jgi:hypothetical protein
MSLFADDCVLDMPRGSHPFGTRFEGERKVREGLAARFEGDCPTCITVTLSILSMKLPIPA